MIPLRVTISNIKVRQMENHQIQNIFKKLDHTHA